MAKIKNIEILRIIGCIAIIMLHLFALALGKNYTDVYSIYEHLKTMSSNSQKAVDLFFILSGLFFTLTFNNKITIYEFVKKKLIRLYPVLVFVMIIYFILSLFHFVNFDFYNNIFCLFFLNGTPFIRARAAGNIGVFWYVSAMFWVLLFYFYVNKHFEKTKINLFAFIAVFVCYGMLVNGHHGKFTVPLLNFCSIFRIGFFKAIGGISLGYIIGNWYKENLQNIQNYKPSAIQTIFYSVLEFLCLYFIVNNLMLHKIKFNNDFIFIIVFTLMIVLFLLNKGVISKFFDKDIFSKLSKYTYSLYMTHPIIITVFAKTLWKNQDILYYNPILNIFYTFAAIIILGVVTYHFVEIPCLQYLLHKYSSKKNV